MHLGAGKAGWRGLAWCAGCYVYRELKIGYGIKRTDIFQNFRWVSWEVRVLTLQIPTFYLVAVYLSVISCNLPPSVV